MKLALVGVGQAGGKIVEKFAEYEARTNSSFITDALAVNTAEADLHGLQTLPESKRILIGQTRVNGHGVGADNELGATVAEEDISEIMAGIDSMTTHKVDAFLVIAALGGGTGSGGAPVIAKHIRERYTQPVYGLGILPSPDEGSIYTLNAARSFQTFVREVDNLLVFDNGAWEQSGESISESYNTINTEIVGRFGVLFEAGDVDDPNAVAESVVDASEIINTLGSEGVSTLGYASAEVEPTKSSLMSRLKPSSTDTGSAETTSRITSLAKKASLGRLTLPCDIGSSERALVVVSGPTSHLSRKGVESARTWVEDETGTMEVRGGDYPLPDENRVATLTLFSGVTDVPRIKELQRVAIEAQNRKDELQAIDNVNPETIADETADDIDPLF